MSKIPNIITLIRLIAAVFLLVVLYKIIPILPVCAWMWCWIGLILFAFPAFYVWFGLDPAIIFVCVIATASATEELLIDLTSSQLKRDVEYINLQHILK